MTAASKQVRPPAYVRNGVQSRRGSLALAPVLLLAILAAGKETWEHQSPALHRSATVIGTMAVK